MAARDPPVVVEAQPCHHVAAESLGEAEPSAPPRRLDRNPHRPWRQCGQDLPDQRDALLDLPDSDPDPALTSPASSTGTSNASVS